MADLKKKIPLNFSSYSQEEMLKRSSQFLQLMKRRRSVRQFSDKTVPTEIIDNCIRTACTAPSGANMQPWHFVAVSKRSTKSEIRRRAEEEEKSFYEKRAPQEWLDALAPLGTDANKAFLEIAPFLIIIFLQRYHLDNNGNHVKHYYPNESVGIATGLLIASLHQAGLATLTHTPSPMNFLNEILGRPSSEKPYLILVTGYPASDAKVPDIRRKDPTETISYID